MCIAILNTKSVTLKKKLLSNCWKNNGDGAGMLYMLDGKMQVFKEMNSFDTFYEEYLRVRKEIPKQNIVLHFRISTHGKINETNCHPFLVHDELGFVHNGMIYDVPTHPDYSDTYMFNETILKSFSYNFEYNENVLDMLQKYIGSGSKLIFLNSEDDYAIVNEKAGHWNMNCWFSNTSYKQVNDWVDYGGIKKYKTTGSSYKSSTQFDSGLSKGFWSSYYDDFYADERGHCECCDMVLYGMKELERGTCEWCHEEQIALMEEREKEDICEYCENDFGGYNNTYGAHLCSDCLGDIENPKEEEVGKLTQYHQEGSNFETIYSAKNRKFQYNLGIMECHTENGVFYYDQVKKMWLKKSNALGV